MCWHLQDNLVEPPNELQECLQNRDQIGIVTYTQDSELSGPNQVPASAIVLQYFWTRTLSDNWKVEFVAGNGPVEL